MLTPEMKTFIHDFTTQNPVVLFMKGTADQPMCGFSARAVGLLKSMNVPFTSMNVLQDEALREGLKEYANWPTFPQLYVKGDLIGGCDIMTEMAENGELAELLAPLMFKDA